MNRRIIKIKKAKNFIHKSKKFMLSDTLALSDAEKARFDFFFEDLSDSHSMLFLSEMNRKK